MENLKLWKRVDEAAPLRTVPAASQSTPVCLMMWRDACGRACVSQFLGRLQLVANEQDHLLLRLISPWVIIQSGVAPCQVMYMLVCLSGEFRRMTIDGQVESAEHV